MRKKAFLAGGALMLALIAAAIMAASGVSAHTVSPGAYAWGVEAYQPDEARPGEYIPGAYVEVGAWHESWVYGIQFLLTGNDNFNARLVYNGQVVAQQHFDGGTFPQFTLRRWVEIPAMRMENFNLQIAYNGECGATVPKVDIKVRLDNLLVYSSGHGGYQEIDISPPPPMPPDGPNITLTC